MCYILCITLEAQYVDLIWMYPHPSIHAWASAIMVVLVPIQKGLGLLDRATWEGRLIFYSWGDSKWKSPKALEKKNPKNGKGNLLWNYIHCCILNQDDCHLVCLLPPKATKYRWFGLVYKILRVALQRYRLLWTCYLVLCLWSYS